MSSINKVVSEVTCEVCIFYKLLYYGILQLVLISLFAMCNHHSTYYYKKGTWVKDNHNHCYMDLQNRKQVLLTQAGVMTE